MWFTFEITKNVNKRAEKHILTCDRRSKTMTEKNAQKKSFMICIRAKYYQGDQVKGDEIEWACSKHWEKKRISYKILILNPEGMNNLEDLGLDGMVLLKLNFKCIWGGGGVCGLDESGLQTVVNVVMKPPFL